MKKLLLFLLLVPSTALAATNLTGDPMSLLREIGDGTPLSEDPRFIIITIIDFILGLTATVLFVLIFISGYRWMTSAGNSDQIKTAKTTILNAMIGLAIVLMSYALSTFILKNIAASAGGTGGTG